MHVRDLTQFLAELADNNNRAWFVMNKPRYDILRAELLELVVKLIREIGKFDPTVIDCNPKKALFRINRDMRFSREKIPYKTHFSAAINPGNLKKPSQGGGPTYYFHIDQTGTLLFAVGEYMPPPDRLRAIRQHLLDDAGGFVKTLKNKRLKQAYGDLQQEGKLTRPPKGFDADTPQIEYIKLKSFIVWREVAAMQVADTLEQTLLAGFRDAYPLVIWLRSVPHNPAEN
jgi:uncharacterized protein (TIGR02453 family)